MTNSMTCERALELAGATTLSGQVLSARRHIHTCPQCQHALSHLAAQLAQLDERTTLEQLLGIDLLDTLCRSSDGIVTWLDQGSHTVLAAVVRFGQQPQRPVAAPLARLGAELQDAAVPERVLRQDEAVTDDGLLRWRARFVIDSSTPTQCLAEIQVHLYDRWDLSGIDVVLAWDSHQRRSQTDSQGIVRFSGIPVEVLTLMQVIICPPQIPTTTNAPQ